MKLDPQAQAVLRDIEAWQKTQPKSRNAAETLAQARSATNSLQRFSNPVPQTVRAEEAKIASRDGPDIPLRIYRPASVENLPTLLWFHGGGAIAGSLQTHEAPLMALAERTQHVVVSVGYRLAPEARFPAQQNDCLDVARFIAERGGALRLRPTQWRIGGDSIGGLYAAVTTWQLRRDTPSSSPAAQVLLYPNTDLQDSRAFASLDENEGRIMTRASLFYEADQSVPRHADRLLPIVSPLLAPDLAGLPPTFLATGEADPLRDEGEAYGRRLAEAGVPLEHKRYDGMIHAFLQMGARIDRTGKLMSDIDAFLRAR